MIVWVLVICFATSPGARPFSFDAEADCNAVQSYLDRAKVKKIGEGKWRIGERCKRVMLDEGETLPAPLMCKP